MVVPESLVDTFVSARALADRHPPGLEQAIVAEFLAAGHFARHVRRMRTLYAERQEALVAALGRELAGAIEASPAEAGMNLTAWLRGNSSDLELSHKAAQVGVVVTPVSAYALEVKLRPGLLLGYAAFSTRQIREGVRKLAQIF
jgi:GntR family transcriptional regulator/MocR family aminotransferase